MKRLTELEWESVVEFCDVLRGEGLDFDDIRAQLRRKPKVSDPLLRRGWGMDEADVAQVEPRVRGEWLNRIKGEEEREEFEEVKHGGAAAVPRQVPVSLGALAEIVQFMWGMNIADAEVVWRPARKVTVYPGDKVREIKGPGRDWLVCAVEICRADGGVDVFPEHAVRAEEQSLERGRNGRRVHLKMLSLEGKRHDAEAGMRRLAAVKFSYFQESSGIESAAELGKINGTSKQNEAQRMARIRLVHERVTGEGADRLNGAVPERGRRRGNQNK